MTKLPKRPSRLIHRHAVLGAMASVTLLAGAALSASALAATTDGAVTRPLEDRGYATVLLNGDPLSVAASTKPARGKKIDFNNSATKSYRAQLSAMRNDYKQWLRANVPGAKVTGEFDISLNAVTVQLNGASLAQIAATPAVKQATYQGVFYKVATDPDLAIIKATEAWTRSGGSAATAGAGVKVAVIDSGIDITHPCFSDAGYAPQTQIGDRTFTNNKVIAAKVFNNRNVGGRYTAEAIEPHGTHVSGTVACNANTPVTTMTVDKAEIPYKMSGIAPRALLGNYNVFPGDVASARSEDILNAMEAAYQDGFDIANMSLGGGQKGVLGIEMHAVDNLDQANMLFAIAAGNDGPGYGTVGSPGAAARALTAGASSVGHHLVYFVTAGGARYAAAKGEFGTPSVDLKAPLRVVYDPASVEDGISQGCTALPDLTGTIALLSRGTCNFAVKVSNAQSAGAVGVIIGNRVPGEPIVMGTTAGVTPVPVIPAYMVSLADRAILKTKDTAPAILPAVANYVFDAVNNDVVADFTSFGPTAVDARIKPDVTAPGVNVLSSIPMKSCTDKPCFAFYNGTSMATPHLAGSAAVLRGQNPTWSAAEVRSAIVNTADRAAVRNVAGGTAIVDVNIVGAGRENLLSAANASVALDPVSISFGPVPTGSGQQRSMDVTLRNLTGAPLTLDLSTAGGDASVGFSVSAPSVTLTGGASATIQVRMNAVKGAAPGGHQGFLNIRAGSVEIAHAAIYMLAK